MPRKCCICNASGNLRFNEIPSDPSLRAKWLVLIPNYLTLGENPKVCEKHFQPTDYEPSMKVRRLKKGVVPMVIPPEDTFAPAEEDKDRYLGFYHQEVQAKDSALKQVQTKLQDVQETIKNITNEGGGLDKQVQLVKTHIDTYKEEKKKSKLKIASLLNELKESKVMCQRQQMELKNKDKTIIAMQRRLKLNEAAVRQTKKCDKISADKLMKLESKHAKEMDEHLKKINGLKEKVERLQAEKRELEQNCYHKNIEQMMINMDVDRKAAFVLDQIRLYNMKVPRYSDSTLNECIMWEDSDPRGYQFARESELLTLPAQHTMKKHLGPMDVEFEVNSNAKTICELDKGREKPEYPSSDKVYANTDHIYYKVPTIVCKVQEI